MGRWEGSDANKEASTGRGEYSPCVARWDGGREQVGIPGGICEQSPSTSLGRVSMLQEYTVIPRLLLFGLVLKLHVVRKNSSLRCQ
jgi:hypothetical protein